MKRLKSKMTFILCLTMLCGVNWSKMSQATDLAPNLRPSFPTLDASPSPSPSDSPDDDDDTEVALNRDEQEKAVTCFRVEKQCESNLATCNANFEQEPSSIKTKVIIFLTGILSGFVLHNNLK